MNIECIIHSEINQRKTDVQHLHVKLTNKTNVYSKTKRLTKKTNWYLPVGTGKQRRLRPVGTGVAWPEARSVQGVWCPLGAVKAVSALS